jgi:carbamoyltransferase
VFRLRLAQVRGTIDRILERKLGPRFHFVQHHLAHAASAYFPSPFERAALLTIDGIGETAGSTLAKANGTRIHHIETFEFPHSLGFAWESICAYTGFSPYDASKLMGLAAYGNPKTFQRQLEEMIHVTDDSYSVDPEAIGFLTAKMDKIESLLGPPRYEGMEL